MFKFLKKKSNREFSSLLDSSNSDEVELKSSSKSYYDSVDSDTANSSDNFYSDVDIDEDLSITKEDKSKRIIFSFSWWEYCVFSVEFLLLIYSFLVFFNILPIFF